MFRCLFIVASKGHFIDTTSVMNILNRRRWVLGSVSLSLVNSIGGFSSSSHRAQWPGKSDRQGMSNRGGGVWGGITHPTALFKSMSTETEEKVIDAGGEIKDISSSGKENEGVVVTAWDEDFIKAGPDKRQYRGIRLANGLDVLLVSDSKTDVEAASVHVKAGHFNDPADRAGLAHFHEHMLFLGTELYPNEDEYEAYLSKNGGSSNAYTDMQDTNYYFSVAPLNLEGNVTSAALQGALHRFAQFFIAPKFDEDAIDRELRAINSEYLNSIPSDVWRSYQLLKHSCDSNHPFHKFGCGNYNTLTNGGDMNAGSVEASGGTSPLPQLKLFWDNYYHAHNIKLCVFSRAPLDSLQATVQDMFSPIRPHPIHPISILPPDTPPPPSIFPAEHSSGIRAFGPTQLAMIREVIPVIDSKTIKIAFAVPPPTDPLMTRCKPHHVISHLLGHESPGTLHALLNHLGFVNGLSSGLSLRTSDFGLFTLSLSLTPQGMQQRDYVLDLAFQYIHLIKSTFTTNPKRIEEYHNELHQMSKIRFDFQEPSDPLSFASGAAKLMHQYEPSKILSAPYLDMEYNATVIQAFLDRLHPQNAIITVSDPSLAKDNDTPTPIDDHEASAHNEPWQIEPWYKAKYRQRHIPSTLVSSWSKPHSVHPSLHLPELNQFIPSDFALRSHHPDLLHNFDPSINYNIQPPQLLIDTPSLRLWHKLDRTFQVPKTSLRLQITSPNVYRSPRSMTYSRLFQRMLNDDLNSYVYDASVAGCNYRVACLPTGFQIVVSGYSEKVPFVLEVLTSRILQLIDQMKEMEQAQPELHAKFLKAKVNLARETKNYRLDSPYETTNYNSRMLLETPAWHVDSYIAEMEGDYAEKDPLTMAECAEVVERAMLGRTKIESLCIGNINEEEVQHVADLISTRFLKNSRPLRDDEIPAFRSLKLPTKQEAEDIFASSELSPIPVKFEEVAFSEAEENCAVEVILQAGSDHTLGYEGIAILELISYLAYNSAYTRLRTKEQLGYIVSAFSRKTSGGSHSLAVVVQSSSTLPEEIEEKIEAWLVEFRKELEDMTEERLGMEAAAIVAQLLERDTKLADEIARTWGEISATEQFSSKLKNPEFNRNEKLAAELTFDENVNNETTTAAQFKTKMLLFFDRYFVADAPERRAMSARVYNQKNMEMMEKNRGKPGFLFGHGDACHLKQYLESWPNAPYWR